MTANAAHNGRMTVSVHEDRYHRQQLISWWDQSRLREAAVLVAGAGALGNELVKNLALVGVGRLVIADLDRIENSNLARCVFFEPGDEGRMKATVLAERVADLNPDVEAIPLVGDIRVTAGLALFSEMDVVVAGLDNREARLYVNQACWKTSTPWVDGAIEGLMGVARVFIPPRTACYECTMTERDHELVAARRTCALLTRDEMIEGKVPTTATTASIIAGVQAQEAVKLLHVERLGEPTLAGAGYQYVGLTHDSYVVRYSQREGCLSHDTYDLERATTADPTTSFGTLVDSARRILGDSAILELEHEIVLGGECGRCGFDAPIERVVEALDAGAGLCPSCGNAWRLHFAHAVDAESPLCDATPCDVGLPPGDVVVARAGLERHFFTLVGSGSALDLTRAGMTA